VRIEAQLAEVIFAFKGEILRGSFYTIAPSSTSTLVAGQKEEAETLIGCSSILFFLLQVQTLLNRNEHALQIFRSTRFQETRV
jgi:hypothetical protein